MAFPSFVCCIEVIGSEIFGKKNYLSGNENGKKGIVHVRVYIQHTTNEINIDHPHP